jgi:hypothetical protein
MYSFLSSYDLMVGEPWLLGCSHQAYALPMDFSEKNQNWQKKEIYLPKNEIIYKELLF